MSTATVLNIKIDKTLKQKAQQTAKALGVPMSIVVASYLRQFIQTRTLTITDQPRLKPEIEAELLSISKEAHAGKNLSPAFHSVEDALEWLHQQT